MRIIQISDFHFTRITWNPLRLLSKRILGNLNWIFTRQNAFSETLLSPLPSLFRSLKADLILLGGDFSTTSMHEEFEAAAQFVKKLPQPWIAIPGNHDFYTRASYRGRDFYRFFTNRREEIAHPVEFFTLKDHCVEAHRISPGWWVVALDTSLATNPYSSQGLFSEKIEAHLKEALSLIPANDSILLLNHYPFFQNDEPRRSLRRGEALEKAIQQDPRIRLYLHGHSHRQVIADLQENGLPIVLDSGSCTFTKRASWNLIDIAPESCQVQSYVWNDGWEKGRKEVFSWKR